MLCFSVGSRACRTPRSSLAWRARAASCKWVTAPPLLLLASMSLAETLLRLIQGEIMGPATPNPLKTHSAARQQAGREAQWSTGWTRLPKEQRFVLEDLTACAAHAVPVNSTLGAILIYTVHKGVFRDQLYVIVVSFLVCSLRGVQGSDESDLGHGFNSPQS